MHKSLMIFGTRPEIIKLGPVYRELKKRRGADVDVFWTGQHVDLADGLLELFDIEIAHRAADVMTLSSLSEKVARIIALIDDCIRENNYQSVIVQGDTISAMAGAMAAFFNRVPCAHVEAGLRTFDLNAPWPEEYARRIISVGAAYHFAPTDRARFNLLQEGVNAHDIIVTGNTVVDALRYVEGQLGENATPHDTRLLDIPTDKKLILVTGHRRESIGEPLRRVMQALRTLSKDDDKYLLFPVHPNPQVRETVEHELADSNVRLVDPLRYTDLVYVLSRAAGVITDSGGIQEEAPSFGIPVIITRDVTERPEVVTAGFGHLVGTDTDLIVAKARTLTDDIELTPSASENPFGDGLAAIRIVSCLIGTPATSRPRAAVITDRHAIPTDTTL